MGDARHKQYLGRTCHKPKYACPGPQTQESRSKMHGGRARLESVVLAPRASLWALGGGGRAGSAAGTAAGAVTFAPVLGPRREAGRERYLAPR
eukprot:3236589-Prymnesium_polylepis.1